MKRDGCIVHETLPHSMYCVAGYVHGCVDGRLSVVVYFAVALDKSSSTLLKCFESATTALAYPLRL